MSRVSVETDVHEVNAQYGGRKVCDLETRLGKLFGHDPWLDGRAPFLSYAFIDANYYSPDC